MNVCVMMGQRVTEISLIYRQFQDEYSKKATHWRVGGNEFQSVKGSSSMEEGQHGEGRIRDYFSYRSPIFMAQTSH